MLKKYFILFGFLTLVSRMASIGADIPLVNHGDTWHYHKGTNSPQANWKTISDTTLDATWATGAGGFGYSTDNPGETANCLTSLSGMQNTYTTVYIRKQFQVTGSLDPAQHLLLRMDWDDGFIAWLDGNYLTNALVNGAPTEPARTATATATHESSLGNSSSSPQPAVTYDLGLVGSRLAVGTHTLAIMGLNQSSTSTDFILVPDLLVGAAPTNCAVTISSPVTWYASNSPVQLCGDLTIASGGTLTIEAGTTVTLGSGVDIVVANGGRILALGTSNAPVVFTKSGGSSWGGITINGGAGSPESQFVHVRINGNSSTAIHSSGGTLLVDHGSFETTSEQYLSLDGSSFVVRDSHFPSGTSGFELAHGTAGIKSGGRGVFLRNFFGVPVGYNDVIDFTGGNRPGPILEVIDNVFGGAPDDILDLDSTDTWVEGNIFLHVHKNGSPDSASAVSGGKDNSDLSQVTVIGNIFYDCDQAATAKQGNFYTLFNNTIVHQTKVGGTDTEAGVVNLADAGTVEAAGMYLEGNIIYDIESLTRNVSTSVVTFANNILPGTWAGPGSGNSIVDPLFKHVPQMSETVFTNWAQAQIMRDWLSLLPGSPAIGTGPNGQDKGGVIPLGATISGEPAGTTTNTSATLTVGYNRASGIPLAGWPNGSGYTHYKWRLDGTNAWSTERSINTPIVLTNLQPGEHYVEVTGKHDSGIYQDDSAYGLDAALTRSATWVVTAPNSLRITSFKRLGPDYSLQFTAEAGQTYTIQYKDALSESGWTKLQDVSAQPASGPVTVTDPAPASSTRFYRIVSPAQ